MRSKLFEKTAMALGVPNLNLAPPYPKTLGDHANARQDGDSNDHQYHDRRCAYAPRLFKHLWPLWLRQ